MLVGSCRGIVGSEDGRLWRVEHQSLRPRSYWINKICVLVAIGMAEDSLKVDIESY